MLFVVVGLLVVSAHAQLCPSSDEIASHRLIAKIPFQRYIPTLVNYLHQECVQLDRVVAKNNEIAKVFNAPRDANEDLIRDLSGFFQFYEVVDRPADITQIAAIAQGLKLMEQSSLNDVDNYNLEQIHRLREGLIHYKGQYQKSAFHAQSAIFSHRDVTLKHVLEIRALLRQPPFRGLQLNRETAVLLAALLKAEIKPLELTTALKNAAVRGGLDDFKYVENINRYNVKVVTALGEALSALIKDKKRYNNAVSEFVALNKAALSPLKNNKKTQRQADDEMVEHGKKLYRLVSIVNNPSARLQRALKILEYIESHTHGLS